MNSFAPRNYAKIAKKFPAMSLEQYRLLAKKHPLDGWYKRADNNGWRPVSLAHAARQQVRPACPPAAGCPEALMVT